MKVLFVSSGNRFDKVTDIIKNQGDSLIARGIRVDYYLIKGLGSIGYLKNIIPLRKQIMENNYDIIHAHYIYSAIIAGLTFKKPIIASIMGSELSKSKIYLLLIRLFNSFFWSGCIVKTIQMQAALNRRDILVLPNGVDLNRFHPLDKSCCQNKLNWISGKRHILFASWPERPEKNFSLAENSISRMQTKNIELHFIKDIPNSELVFYYNAADAVLLTSKREGSPNVIKEAMACNRPIVSTDVGDVSILLGGMDNCHITSFDTAEIGQRLDEVLKCNTLPDGRRRLLELDLTAESVAERLIGIYEKAVSKSQKTIVI